MTYHISRIICVWIKSIYSDIKITLTDCDAIDRTETEWGHAMGKLSISFARFEWDPSVTSNPPPPPTELCGVSMILLLLTWTSCLIKSICRSIEIPWHPCDVTKKHLPVIWDTMILTWHHFYRSLGNQQYDKTPSQAHKQFSSAVSAYFYAHTAMYGVIIHHEWLLPKKQRPSDWHRLDIDQTVFCLIDV